MKVFLSADIEGVTGITDWAEADLTHDTNAEFRERMTAEVVAACEGALAAGATELLVKDAHWTGRNLYAERLPREAKLLRGWSGHPYSMVQGLDATFHAALFVGWHSAGGRGGNPLAHTLSSSRLRGIEVNGVWASEFLLHVYAAALERVPVAFVSGDEELCAEVRSFDPGIATVAVTRGTGAATLARHPAEARDAIRAEVERALAGPLRVAPAPLPERFDVRVVRKDARDAYRASFYPGARLVDATTVGFETTDWFEVLRLLQFVTH
ncbi:MAG: M55 family metallopeptidase [Planctomycetota bacterium]